MADRGGSSNPRTESSSVLQLVERSAVLLDKAKKGFPVAEVAKAMKAQPNVRRAQDLRMLSPVSGASLNAITGLADDSMLGSLPSMDSAYSEQAHGLAGYAGGGADWLATVRRRLHVDQRLQAQHGSSSGGASASGGGVTSPTGIMRTPGRSGSISGGGGGGSVGSSVAFSPLTSQMQMQLYAGAGAAGVDGTASHPHQHPQPPRLHLHGSMSGGRSHDLTDDGAGLRNPALAHAPDLRAIASQPVVPLLGKPISMLEQSKLKVAGSMNALKSASSGAATARPVSEAAGTSRSGYGTARSELQTAGTTGTARTARTDRSGGMSTARDDSPDASPNARSRMQSRSETPGLTSPRASSSGIAAASPLVTQTPGRQTQTPGGASRSGLGSGLGRSGSSFSVLKSPGTAASSASSAASPGAAPGAAAAAAAAAPSPASHAATTAALEKGLGMVQAAAQLKRIKERNAVSLQFNSSPGARLFYGSTVALESLDGWYLGVHPRSGVVTVREPEDGWYERGLMPFRKHTSRRGQIADPPYYLFKLINLESPLANGPIRYGDPVWLQVIEGRGDGGWVTGSILIPYLQQAIQLDPAAVDINGRPYGTGGGGGGHDGSSSSGGGAGNTMFGLPVTSKGAKAVAAKHWSQEAAHEEKKGDSEEEQQQYQQRAEQEAASKRASASAAAAAAPSSALEQKMREVLLKEDTPVHELPRRSFRFVSAAERFPFHIHHSPAADAVSAAVAASGQEMTDFLITLQKTSQDRSRVNPLDRLRQHIGVPRPFACHVPYPGSAADYLPGPVTPHTPAGVYYRRDPGYDKLYAAAIARASVAGKWKLQYAWKEVTDDGFIIGGLGIEGSAAGRSGLAMGGGGGAGNASKLKPQATAKPESNGPVLKGKTAKALADSEGGGSGGAQAEEDEADEHAWYGNTNRKKVLVDMPLREYITNMSCIYLEQDFFYVAYTPATGSVDSPFGDAPPSNPTAPWIPVPQAPGAGGASGAGATAAAAASATGSSGSGGGEAGGPPATLSTIADGGGGGGGGGGSSATGRGGRATASNATTVAADSAQFLQQPHDGISGGNRRVSYLQPHTSGLGGPFKVDRRGVFRIRMLQTGDKGGTGSGASKDDVVALKARGQLRKTERLRLGRAAVAGPTAGGGGGGDGDGDAEIQPIRAQKGDLTAAANLARNARAHREFVNSRADEVYLYHERRKAEDLEGYFDTRLRREIPQALAAEAAAMRAYALDHMSADMKAALLHGANTDNAGGSGSGGRSRSGSPGPGSDGESESAAADLGGARDGSERVPPPSSSNRTRLPAPHQHPDGQPCELCRGPGGEPIFLLDLCSSVGEASRQVQAEASATAKHLARRKSIVDAAHALTGRTAGASSQSTARTTARDRDRDRDSVQASPVSARDDATHSTAMSPVSGDGDSVPASPVSSTAAPGQEHGHGHGHGHGGSSRHGAVSVPALHMPMQMATAGVAVLAAVNLSKPGSSLGARAHHSGGHSGHAKDAKDAKRRGSQVFAHHHAGDYTEAIAQQDSFLTVDKLLVDTSAALAVVGSLQRGIMEEVAGKTQWQAVNNQPTDRAVGNRMGFTAVNGVFTMQGLGEQIQEAMSDARKRARSKSPEREGDSRAPVSGSDASFSRASST